MKTNQNSIKRNFRIAAVLSLCTFLVTQVTGLAETYAESSPFGQKESSLQYRIMGKIVNVQGNTFLVRKGSGETVKLSITDDTNMFCEDSSRESNASPEKSVSTGNVDFKPDSPTTKGFRIGDCPPVPGTYIKADTTDVGTVTFLRTLDPARIHTASARIADQTERLGLPQRYSYSADGFAIFPVVREGLGQTVLENQQNVLTADGKNVGNLKKIIIDTKTGDIAYGVVKLDQEAIETKGMEVSRGSLMPLPWSAFQQSEKDGAMMLKVTSQQLANLPGYGEGINVADIRAYWEMHDPGAQDIELPTPHYMGADRFDKMQLEKARKNYQAVRNHFLNLDTVYSEDIQELERAREKFDIAFDQYLKGGGEKTIQQKLQSQIFR